MCTTDFVGKVDVEREQRPYSKSCPHPWSRVGDFGWKRNRTASPASEHLLDKDGRRVEPLLLMARDNRSGGRAKRHRPMRIHRRQYIPAPSIAVRDGLELRSPGFVETGINAVRRYVPPVFIECQPTFEREWTRHPGVPLSGSTQFRNRSWLLDQRMSHCYVCWLIMRHFPTRQRP